MHPTTISRPARPLRAALYARVSTDTQTTENQILELREYATRQGWAPTEYLDPASPARRSPGPPSTV
jgi:DNA invertase Pin-like site-specific DNA recombinase